MSPDRGRENEPAVEVPMPDYLGIPSGALGQGTPQTRLQVQPFAAALMGLGTVKTALIAATLFGPEHGGLRLHHQVIVIVAGQRIQRDTDTGGDIDPPLEIGDFIDQLQQPLVIRRPPAHMDRAAGQIINRARGAVVPVVEIPAGLLAAGQGCRKTGPVFFQFDLLR